MFENWWIKKQLKKFNHPNGFKKENFRESQINNLDIWLIYIVSMFCMFDLKYEWAREIIFEKWEIKLSKCENLHDWIQLDVLGSSWCLLIWKSGIVCLNIVLKLLKNRNFYVKTLN